MKRILVFIIIITSLHACKRCHLDLIIGEDLQIPMKFNGFTDQEINSIKVYRIDLDTNIKTDTFRFQHFITPYFPLKDGSVKFSDRPMNNKNYGYYDSYLNNCHLVFDWYSGRDTLKNLVIKKSKEKVKDKCYENDPNVKIDFISFSYKNNTYNKGDLVTINK
ncbi:MAG: hypothetical protein Q8K70_02460 [Bacteroidota bacterium]|nr:hypothetical protein [Bacteroidota bacterium]